MSALTVWRNPQGEDENWVHRKDEFTRFPQVWTLVKCEAAYTLLGGLAAVEYIAAYPVRGITYPFSSCRSQPYQAAVQWQQDSKIACQWAISNLWSNLTEPNMHTSPDYAHLEKRFKEGAVLKRPWEFNYEDPFEGKLD